MTAGLWFVSSFGHRYFLLGNANQRFNIDKTMNNIICKIDLYKVLPEWLLRDISTNYKSISKDYAFTMAYAI